MNKTQQRAASVGVSDRAARRVAHRGRREAVAADIELGADDRTGLGAEPGARHLRDHGTVVGLEVGDQGERQLTDPRYGPSLVALLP